MKHEMKLALEPFDMIADGRKTIELRLYDDKRKKIKIGDEIQFICIEPPHNTLNATVIGLHRYNSFLELYNHLDLLKCGYTEKDIDSAKPEDMNLYYSKEQQEKYGVVGIELNIVR